MTKKNQTKKAPVKKKVLRAEAVKKQVQEESYHVRLIVRDGKLCGVGPNASKVVIKRTGIFGPALCFEDLVEAEVRTLAALVGVPVVQPQKLELFTAQRPAQPTASHVGEGG